MGIGHFAWKGFIRLALGLSLAAAEPVPLRIGVAPHTSARV